MTDLDKRIDEIMVELTELEYQATHERSHYYVKSVVSKSADIIYELQAQLAERDTHLKIAVEALKKISQQMEWVEYIEPVTDAQAIDIAQTALNQIKGK